MHAWEGGRQGGREGRREEGREDNGATRCLGTVTDVTSTSGLLSVPPCVRLFDGCNCYECFCVELQQASQYTKVRLGEALATLGTTQQQFEKHRC